VDRDCFRVAGTRGVLRIPPLFGNRGPGPGQSPSSRPPDRRTGQARQGSKEAEPAATRTRRRFENVFVRPFIQRGRYGSGVGVWKEVPGARWVISIPPFLLPSAATRAGRAGLIDGEGSGCMRGRPVGEGGGVSLRVKKYRFDHLVKRPLHAWTADQAEGGIPAPTPPAPPAPGCSLFEQAKLLEQSARRSHRSFDCRFTPCLRLIYA
jgi:hypothetical protein